MHVYLSDRLFVALAKRLGVPRRRLATLRTRQQREVRKGVAVSLFSLARLERWIDDSSSERLLSCARRVIKKHPKYRRDLIEVRQGTRARRRSRGESRDDLPTLDAHADATVLSIEGLLQEAHAPQGQVQSSPAEPHSSEPHSSEPHSPEPGSSEPLAGPLLEIGSLLMGDVISPPAQSFKDALEEPLSRDLGADSALFAVADWSASEDFGDPFAVEEPFDSSEDPFAAGASSDPFARAAEGSLETVGDPFAAAAQQADAFVDPFAASSLEIFEDPFSSNEDPFALAQPDPYASVGGEAFGSSKAPANWLGRDSQEFDPFGPKL